LIASAANLGLKNWSDGWRLSYGGNIVLAIALLICLHFMPESPRWLAGNASDEELKQAMEKLRYEDEIESEIKKLKQEVEEEKLLGSASWSELLSSESTVRGRLLLGMSLQAFQQLCGINAIMFYAPDILNTFFTEDQVRVSKPVISTSSFFMRLTFSTLSFRQLVGLLASTRSTFLPPSLQLRPLTSSGV
jgi:hypothetical protein